VIAIGAILVVSFSIVFADSIEDMITGSSGQISAGGLQAVEGSLTGAIVGAISATGYYGVFVLMLLEGTSVPVPSEVVLPFAGYLVSTGRLEFWLTVVIATAAGVLGGIIDYYIGKLLGMKAITNYGSKFFISPDQMRRIEVLFAKHGALIVFASRLIPGVRTLVSFPAGSAKMNLPKFVLFSAVGCFAFDAALVYVGDYLGAHWNAIRSLGTLELGATVIVLVAAVWLFFRMQRKQPSEGPNPRN
jgi:membrane protein DedA with SNARE-associated domain